MLTFIILVGLCAIIALGFLVLAPDFELQHFLTAFGVGAVVAGICCAVMYYSGTSDTETWSGRVVSKRSERVGCEHSYQCMCVPVCSSDSKGNETCTEVCQTCYEHSYDVDWNVETTLGEYHIHRVDRQGLREPPRFTSVRAGEPVADTRSYTNYIKAAPDTLFRRTGDYVRFKDTLPAYPQQVYDYWHMNRFVKVSPGIRTAPDAQWNADIEEANATLGHDKQVNIIVVLVAGMPREWFYALQQAWLGGKKNDFVVVIDTAYAQNLLDDKIEWVDVMAWDQDDLVKVKVRDAIMLAGQVYEPIIMAWVSDVVKENFVRKPMADYKYLQASITPSTLGWVVSVLLCLLATIVAAILTDAGNMGYFMGIFGSRTYNGKGW